MDDVTVRLVGSILVHTLQGREKNFVTLQL